MEGEYAARLQKLGHQKFNLAGHEKTRINYLVQIDYVSWLILGVKTSQLTSHVQTEAIQALTRWIDRSMDR